MAGIVQDIRFIRENVGRRQKKGFQDPKFCAKIDEFLKEAGKSLGMAVSSNEYYGLDEIYRVLEQRSFEKFPIPKDFLETITVFNQEAMVCLRESQARFDVWKRNHTMEQVILFLWKALFIGFLQRIDADYRERFSLYGTLLWEKDHAQVVRAQDIREKIQALHDMLKSSWTHLVPPRMQDIIFPDSHLKNNMLMEEGSEWWGIPPVTGFFEPPTLKPGTVPLSISDYIAFECRELDVENPRVCDDGTVANFVKFARDPEYYDWCNPFESDTTFLTDLMERYGSTTYLQICGMFPRLSDYHPPD